MTHLLSVSGIYFFNASSVVSAIIKQQGARTHTHSLTEKTQKESNFKLTGKGSQFIIWILLPSSGSITPAD